MAAEFLRKLVARPPALSAEVSEALDELRRVAKDAPSLAVAARLLADVLHVLYAEPVQTTTPILSSDQVQSKLGRGIPMLRDEALDLDIGAFTRRWRRVGAAVQRHRQDSAARGIAEALHSGQLDAHQLIEVALAGQPEVIHASAQEQGLDAGLTAMVLRLTLFPVLCEVSKSLAPLWASRHWEHGYCPACGSWPLLGEFRGLEQTRFLRCGLCAASWEFPRLGCPFCGTTDHRQLGYLCVEGEENKCRAATCNLCKNYVKMLSTLAELTPPHLLVADLKTTHLDLVAADRCTRHSGDKS
jgi:FdhE protein